MVNHIFLKKLSLRCKPKHKANFSLLYTKHCDFLSCGSNLIPICKYFHKDLKFKEIGTVNISKLD